MLHYLPFHGQKGQKHYLEISPQTSIWKPFFRFAIQEYIQKSRKKKVFFKNFFHFLTFCKKKGKKKEAAAKWVYFSRAKGQKRVIINQETSRWMKPMILYSKWSLNLTLFENYLKSLIQHCERSELRLHFEWTKVN